MESSFHSILMILLHSEELIRLKCSCEMLWMNHGLTLEIFFYENAKIQFSEKQVMERVVKNENLSFLELHCLL